MTSSFRQIINRAVTEKRILVVRGAHDALSARLIEKIGFETYFIGGFPVVGSRYGVPDIGLKGFGEISAAVRDILAACRLPRLRRRRRRLWRRQERGAHGADLRAHGRERDPHRGPAMAQALRSYGR